MTSYPIRLRSRHPKLLTAAFICGAALIVATAHAAPLATPKTKAAHPKPIAPALIHHAPGATNLDPGLNTNSNNDPTPGAFQYGTGSDPFNGETGEGSGPESTRRTAAIHDTFTNIAATKKARAAAVPIPPGKLAAVHVKPATPKK